MWNDGWFYSWLIALGLYGVMLFALIRGMRTLYTSSKVLKQYETLCEAQHAIIMGLSEEDKAKVADGALKLAEIFQQIEGSAHAKADTREGSESAHAEHVSLDKWSGNGL